MNFLVDGLIIGIFIACCIWGFKSGLVKMAVSFLKNIIAIIVATIFASRLGALFYEWFFKKAFEGFVVDKVSGWLGVDPDKNIDIGPLIEAQHSEFFKFAKKLGFDFGQINDKYTEFGQSAGDLMIEYIAKPLATAISNVVAFILIFAVSVLVILIVGFILGKVAKLPLLNVTNRVLGLAVGILLGIIFVFIFAALVKAVVPYISISGEHFAANTFEEGTIIYRYMVNHTPAGLIEDILDVIGVK